MSQYAASPAPVPGVVTWFKVYAGFMALLYLLVTGLGALFLFGVFEEHDPGGNMVAGVILVGVGVVFLVLYALTFVLAPSPGVWIYDLILICLGLTSCLTIPVCIPLLIFWLKPEAQRYFGK
jgi:hypothetical protein